MTEPTKDEFYEKVATLFAQKGVLQTTFTDIHNETKIPESTIYRKYKTKENLLLQLYKFFWGTLDKYTKEIQENEWIPTAPQKLKIMIARSKDFFGANRALLHLVNSTFLTTQHDGEEDPLGLLKKEIRTLNDAVLKTVDDTIKLGQERGELINDLPAEVIRTIVMGATRGLLYGMLVVPNAKPGDGHEYLDSKDVLRGIDFVLESFETNKQGGDLCETLTINK